MVFESINANHAMGPLYVNIKYSNTGVDNVKGHHDVNMTKKKHTVNNVWALQFVYIPKKE